MLNRVNPHATTISALGVNQNKGCIKCKENAAPREVEKDNPAAELDISERGRIISREIQLYDAGGFLKLDEEFFRQDLKEQRRLEQAQTLSELKEIDPFENEFQILGVKYIFNEGTLEKFISDRLEGKAKNASLVASELGQMVRGTIHNPNASVEERAIIRETAIKHAEHIAENYFDDPDEAKAFLEGIYQFAENDILREKGYIVFDNSDMPPFKAYTMPGAPEGYITGAAFARQYGSASTHEIFENPKKLEAFFAALNSNGQQWKNNIIKDFNDREKEVTAIINRMKGSMNESSIQKSLQRLLKAF